MSPTETAPDLAPQAPAPLVAASPVRRRYVGAPGRQIHLTEAGTANAATPRLYCLHATAYSGRSFLPFLQALAPRRYVAAPDTPGYGGSDAPRRRLGIPEYATALAEALSMDSGGAPIDLLGYHTGALVAAELARQRPELVRRLVLIGIPYFTGEERERWRGRLARPMALTEDLAQFEERWDFFITQRREGVTLERGFDNFVDELRAWPDGWWAHEAAFTFDVEDCFARVRQPTLVINPDNHLSEASRRAAEAMPSGRVLEVAALDNAIFDIAPDLLAAAVDNFLRESGDAPRPD